MDARKIISRRLTQDQIREEAENFRKVNVFNENVPVDIERVVEATLGIRNYRSKGILLLIQMLSRKHTPLDDQ